MYPTAGQLAVMNSGPSLKVQPSLRYCQGPEVERTPGSGVAELSSLAAGAAVLTTTWSERSVIRHPGISFLSAFPWGSPLTVALSGKVGCCNVAGDLGNSRGIHGSYFFYLSSLQSSASWGPRQQTSPLLSALLSTCGQCSLLKALKSLSSCRAHWVEPPLDYLNY